MVEDLQHESIVFPTPNRKDGRIIRVNFFPFSKGNPYQHLLSSHLSKHRVEVLRESSLKGLLCQTFMEGYKFDIMHLHWLPQIQLHPIGMVRVLLFIFLLNSFNRNGIKILLTAHNLIPHDSHHPLLDRLLAAKVANMSVAVIAHSASAAKEVIASLKIRPASKVRVIPHGNYISAYENHISKNEARKKLGLDDPDKLVFLFLGAIRPYKGVLELIDAFSDISDPHTTLLVAGKPFSAKVQSDLEEKIKNNSSIRFFPKFIPDMEIQVFMNACDVVVFPYKRILTSGAAILAMSFGKACVVPRIGTMTDFFTESDAFFYDQNKTDDLKRVLKKVSTKKNILEKMGLNNFKRAKSWDWETVAAITANIYFNSLDRKPQVPSSINSE